ncbi:hypothetical protein [Pseudomonas fluorescens]|uniref:hypothetical protein n=1 Tax=Pseudomonas fluorescens TaxID=294 RepID=UPI0035691C3E
MNPLMRINWLARGGLAFMFAYHGLVPKLLWLSQGERAMIQAHGIEQVQLFATLAGVGVVCGGLEYQALNGIYFSQSAKSATASADVSHTATAHSTAMASSS